LARFSGVSSRAKRLVASPVNSVAIRRIFMMCELLRLFSGEL
jgi:hypothetical protein